MSVRPRARGTRKILSVEPTNPGFAWRLACGHEERKLNRPRDGQTTALCWTCRRATAGQPVFEPDAKNASKQAELQHWRREHGLCPTCGSPAIEGKKMCAHCLGRAKEQWHKRKVTSKGDS